MIRFTALLLVLTVTLVGCAPQRTGGTAPSGAPPSALAQQQTSPKRITVAIMGDPSGLSNTIDRAGAGGTPGLDALEEMVNAGLTQVNAGGVQQPQLAEAVPTIENGMWKLLPDGRMETSWRIKPNVLWHDGAPLTTDDLAFTVKVGQDRDLPVFSNAGYGAVESVEPIDARTVT